MVSLLYRICGEAQAYASVQAVESAKGVTADLEKQWSRMQLLNMEIVREHVWRILLDWPVVLGGHPDREAMSEIMNVASRWQRLIDPKQQAYRLNSVQEASDQTEVKKLFQQCEELLIRTIYTMPIEQWAAMERADDLIAWAEKGESIAACFLRNLISRGWASTGHSDIGGLPDMKAEDVAHLLGGQEARVFVATPSIDGKTYETTAYSRYRTHPLIHDLSEKFGSGLLSRFVAVLLEVAVTMVSMSSSECASAQDPVESNRTGVGMVEAARGRLIHYVSLDGDRVENYRIVAPTEWNFHPHGALVEGLKNLDASNRPDFEQQAHLLVYAMDPCVSYSLEVTGYA